MEVLALREPYKALGSLMCLASRLSLSWTALGLSCPRTLTSQMLEICGTDPKKARQSLPSDTNRDNGFVKTLHPRQGWPLLA